MPADIPYVDEIVPPDLLDMCDTEVRLKAVQLALRLNCNTGEIAETGEFEFFRQ
jgi:hypothetical protein